MRRLETKVGRSLRASSFCAELSEELVNYLSLSLNLANDISHFTIFFQFVDVVGCFSLPCIAVTLSISRRLSENMFRPENQATLILKQRPACSHQVLTVGLAFRYLLRDFYQFADIFRIQFSILLEICQSIQAKLIHFSRVGEIFTVFI